MNPSLALLRDIVGLDIEWNPYSDAGTTNSPATLQLCIGRNCLIFQIIHASGIPQALINFLSNGNYNFVGVGIGRDRDKLYKEYGLEVAREVDLGLLAAERLGDWSLCDAGLVMLAGEVLGKGFEKPRWVTMSNWDAYCLSLDQIQYACLDAFVSFEIGRCLRASSYKN